MQDNKGVGQPTIILIVFQHQVALSYFELGDKNDPFINGRGGKLLNLIFDIAHSLRRGKPLPASPLLWPMQDNCTEKIGAMKKNRCSEEQIGEVKKIGALEKIGAVEKNRCSELDVLATRSDSSEELYLRCWRK